MIPGLIALFLASASSSAAPSAPAGAVKLEASAFGKLVPDGAKVQVLAGGFTWAEGPVWIERGEYLLLSDPPSNRIYRFFPGQHAAKLFMEPSGGTLSQGFRETGSNGLKLAGRGKLLVADEGNRAIALLDLATRRKRLLAQRFGGKKLNSPNDIAVGPDGAIWFTDPPYGLDGVDQSPMKEQRANRVYRLAPNGKLSAVESRLRYPNGIAFSPDGRRLYVSNSDPGRAIILAWDVSPGGKLSRRRVFADLTALAAKGLPGLPDGMCMDEKGDLWASGPGGIHVFSPGGEELGTIATGAAISNCTFGGRDGRTLFMTSTHQLASLRTNVRGAPPRLPKRRLAGPER